MAQDIHEQIRLYCACLQEWDASYADYAKSVGLSYTSLMILTAICETPQCTQKYLCEVCFLPKQTVNAVISAFYKKGWLRLEELPEDRRNKTIHLTPLGRDEAGPILERVRLCEQQAMEHLTEQERDVLLSATRRYVSECKNAMKGL